MKTETFVIFTGDQKPMNLKAIYAESLNPLDLTNCTEIAIRMPLASGSFQTLLLSDDEVEIVSPAVLGKFTAFIETALSDLLNVGEFQSIDVTFTIDDDVTTVRYVQALTVLQR